MKPRFNIGDQVLYSTTTTVLGKGVKVKVPLYIIGVFTLQTTQTGDGLQFSYKLCRDNPMEPREKYHMFKSVIEAVPENTVEPYEGSDVSDVLVVR